MTARIQSLPAGSSGDPIVNGILEFSRQGFGDTQMFWASGPPTGVAETSRHHVCLLPRR